MVTAREYTPTFSGRWLCDRKRTTKRRIFSDFVSLDTETSHNHNPDNPVAWVCQWCVAIGDDVVVGRTPSELMVALDKIIEHAGADKDKHILVFVHNLSYDICYLRPFLLEHYGSKCKMLAVSNHKYISFSVGCLEFRCSYKLSNRSLAKFGEDMNTTHRKLEGAIDYDAIYTQQEELPAISWEYQVEDVLTLREALQKLMASYGDTPATVPLTSTGYVRRECRRHYKSDRKNRKRFATSKVNADFYALLRRAFAGGLTHGNRFFAEETVCGQIAHRDFTSHYPSCQICSDEFPRGKFAFYSETITQEEYADLLKEYCIVCELFLKNPRIKSRDVTLPVIASAKAYEGAITRLHIDTDNGRVLSAQGIFSLVVTEHDYKWIMRQYDADEFYIGETWISPKGHLPKFLRDSVNEFFFGKSDIKEKIKQETDPDKRIDLEIELMKKKNMLNGIYGMTASRLVRSEFSIDEAGEWHETENPDPQKAIDKYYANENNFCRYEHGVYTTAIARSTLLYYIYDVIEASGGTYLYADTDSCFYLTNDDVEQAVENENLRRRKLGDEKGFYIDTEAGKRVYYNQFEREERDYIDEFRFLHAKCYAYVYHGKLKCVIAGVSPFEDATRQYTREQELREIDNLADGFVFRRCGGTTASYNDAVPIGTYEHNGQPQEVASWCIISRVEKTINSELSLYDKFVKWEVDE